MEAVESMKQNVVKAPFEAGLGVLLQGYKVAGLQEIAKELDVESASKMKKQELVDAITEKVTDPKTVYQMAMAAPEKAYHLASVLAFGKKMKGKVPDEKEYAYFQDRGCVFISTDEEITSCVMPVEVRDAFEEAKKMGLAEKRERVALCGKYIRAMVNLYGVLSRARAMELFGKCGEKPMNEAELQEMIDQYGNRENSFYADDTYLYHELLHEDKIYLNVAQRQEGKRVYQPDKYDLVKYADDLYYENTVQMIRLKKFLLTYTKLDEVAVQQLADEMHMCVLMERTMNEILKLMENSKVTMPNKEKAGEMVRLLVGVMNNTRLWSNNGMTCEELRMNYSGLGLKDKKPQPVRVHKIGRNDPCPCGSGKKYKKCCGR